MLSSTEFGFSRLDAMQSMTSRAAACSPMFALTGASAVSLPRAAHNPPYNFTDTHTTSAGVTIPVPAHRTFTALFPTQQLPFAKSGLLSMDEFHHDNGSGQYADVDSTEAGKHVEGDKERRELQGKAVQLHPTVALAWYDGLSISAASTLAFNASMSAAMNSAANYRHEEALDYFNKAADIADKHGNELSAIRARHGAATCLHNLRGYHRANQMWSEQFSALGCDPKQFGDVTIFRDLTKFAGSEQIADTCRGAAYTYLALEQPVEAFHLGNAAEAFYRQQHGDNCEQIVLCYDIIGLAMCQIGGIRSNTERGARYIYTAWQLRKQHHGDDHVDTLRSLRNYAEIMMILGERNRAKELWYELMQTYGKLYGKYHADTLHATLAWADCLSPGAAVPNYKTLYEQCLGISADQMDFNGFTSDSLLALTCRVKNSIGQLGMAERGGPWLTVKLGWLSVKPEGTVML